MFYNMKKIMLIQVIGYIALLMLSCGNDDDSPTPISPEENLLGFWKNIIENEEFKGVFFDSNGSVYALGESKLTLNQGYHVIFENSVYTINDDVINIDLADDFFNNEASVLELPESNTLAFGSYNLEKSHETNKIIDWCDLLTDSVLTNNLDYMGDKILSIADMYFHDSFLYIPSYRQEKIHKVNVNDLSEVVQTIDTPGRKPLSVSAQPGNADAYGTLTQMADETYHIRYRSIEDDSYSGQSDELTEVGNYFPHIESFASQTSTSAFWYNFYADGNKLMYSNDLQYSITSMSHGGFNALDILDEQNKLLVAVRGSMVLVLDYNTSEPRVIKSIYVPLVPFVQEIIGGAYDSDSSTYYFLLREAEFDTATYKILTAQLNINI